MLIHGDLDETVPIEQSEEMFSALRRLGRTCTFVRYWGEGHGIFLPKNYLDEWSRIYAWFGLYLRSETVDHSTPGGVGVPGNASMSSEDGAFPSVTRHRSVAR
jgi:hypothetical protein